MADCADMAQPEIHRSAMGGQGFELATQKFNQSIISEQPSRQRDAAQKAAAKAEAAANKSVKAKKPGSYQTSVR
jgi:hypothetical protein